MKIAKVESLHADAGRRNFDFLKITTDMEIDPDVVPWHDDLVTSEPQVVDGHLLLPSGPGWGTEVNEEVVRAHPPRRRAEREAKRLDRIAWISSRV